MTLLTQLRELSKKILHLPNWEYHHHGEPDDEAQFYNWYIMAVQQSGNTVHVCTGESNHAAGELIVELRNHIDKLLDVCEAVKHCGARIQTIGNGFDARNVYVVEPKQMVAIGKALVALDGETNAT